jgi:hypothetical protein
MRLPAERLREERLLWWDLGPASLLLERISLNGYLTRNCPTLVAIGPLKKYVNHEVEAENANCQKHRNRHGDLPGAERVLPELTKKLSLDQH